MWRLSQQNNKCMKERDSTSIAELQANVEINTLYQTSLEQKVTYLLLRTKLSLVH